jgi:hypothetical protein
MAKQAPNATMHSRSCSQIKVQVDVRQGKQDPNSRLSQPRHDVPFPAIARYGQPLASVTTPLQLDPEATPLIHVCVWLKQQQVMS